MGRLRKTRKRTRKCGGATPNTIHYKYTKNLRRGQWVDTIYPYGQTLVSILPRIGWRDFRYTGPMIIQTDGNEDRVADNKRVFSIRTTETSPKIYKTNGHCVPPTAAPYEVFGGAACELWGKKIPEIAIHKYIDITGDIDVKVSLPTVVPDDVALRTLISLGGDDAVKPLMVYEDAYTPYGDAYTHWLFDEIVAEVGRIAPQFNIKELRLPQRDENYETALGDLHAAVGNLLITRLLTENRSMIKIQISTTALPDITNHIVEFIVSPDGSFRSNTKFTVDGIYVQGPIELLQGQVKGLTDRADGIKNTSKERHLAAIENYPSFYKFDNHCARLIYIASLMKFLEGKRYPENGINFPFLDSAQAFSILEKLYTSGRGTMCDIHFGPNYMDRLISMFESMKYIGKGALTTHLHPIRKAQLNKAKATP